MILSVSSGDKTVILMVIVPDTQQRWQKYDTFSWIPSVFVSIRHQDDYSRKQAGNCVSVINLEMVHYVRGWVRPFVS